MPALASHSPTIYLREKPLEDAANGWIGDLFDSRNVDLTVKRLVEAQSAYCHVSRR
ncbi:hypothetical protein [Amycolatopsis silviterrae]|uniref:Uncharacterized protein n=1 Tax=Amycolatopsis silviterrae TaxID=1656914 RepID=A0ABW5HN54_9PSEU